MWTGNCQGSRFLWICLVRGVSIDCSVISATSDWKQQLVEVIKNLCSGYVQLHQRLNDFMCRFRSISEAQVRSSKKENKLLIEDSALADEEDLDDHLCQICIENPIFSIADISFIVDPV